MNEHTPTGDDDTVKVSVSAVERFSGGAYIPQSVSQPEQAKFLLMLREDNRVSQTAAIVGHCRSLCKCTHNALVERVRNVLPHTIASPDDISRISEELDCAPPDFFDGVDSGHLLESFAKKHMNFIVSDTICHAYTVKASSYM